jgi:hypothetical protein
MSRRVSGWFVPVVLGVLACGTWAMGKEKEVVDPEEAAKDPDFAVQGEYLGEGVLADGKKEKVGAHVVAQGNGKFQVVVYRGGLPGEGWKRGDERFSMEGEREGDATSLKGRKLTGKIANGRLIIGPEDGKPKINMARIERQSATLDAKPPAGAKVLFDGTNGDGFQEQGHFIEAMKTMLSGVTSKDQFNDCTLHLEFRLSWMPEARGQGRSNSGVYLHDCYEIQVLDSFGLEGENNECGGFYSIRRPDVNMCFPPMTWQTYDIDFVAPKYEDGKKVANARIKLRHNGVVIHDFEIEKGTPGRKGEGPGPRAIHIQGHGNRVMYRNMWVVGKK